MFSLGLYTTFVLVISKDKGYFNIANLLTWSYIFRWKAVTVITLHTDNLICILSPTSLLRVNCCIFLFHFPGQLYCLLSKESEVTDDLTERQKWSLIRHWENNLKMKSHNWLIPRFNEILEVMLKKYCDKI